MSDINVGDRVRIKDRSDWPLPSGYQLAQHEGTVFELVEETEGYQGYITVLLDKDTSGIDKSIPLAFRIESVEKIG